MVARRPLPDSDHIARFVPFNKQYRHPDTGELLGLTAAAFAIRNDDRGGLSSTWIEFFGEKSAESIASAAVAFRESQPSKKLGKQSLFAIAAISQAKADALLFKKSIRVVHDPVPGNPGHAEVRHFDDDDLELLEYFARETFSEYHLTRDIEFPDS